MKGFRLFRTIQIKLIVIYVLLILVAMQLIGVYFVRTLESTFDNNFTTSLNNQANLIAEYVKPILISLRNTDAAGRPQDWQESLGDIVNNFNRFSGAEVQIIDENGFVLSSSLNQTVIGQKSTYPEVSRVLQGIVPQPENVVDEFGVRMRSLVIPITNEGNIIGAVIHGGFAGRPVRRAEQHQSHICRRHAAGSRPDRHPRGHPGQHDHRADQGDYEQGDGDGGRQFRSGAGRQGR